MICSVKYRPGPRGGGEGGGRERWEGELKLDTTGLKSWDGDLLKRN